MHGRLGCAQQGALAWEAWQGVSMAGCMSGRGACVAEGGMCGSRVCVAGETATPAGGTHPTGIHSCYIYCVF